MPNGECVVIHLGQAGVQVAHAMWELFCLEHGIYPNGGILCDSLDPNDRPHTFYSETRLGKYVPRALMVDFEPTVIDEVRTGTYRQLFSPSCLITGKEDAANNFARGYYTLGPEFIEVTYDTIRKLVELCDSMQGFFLCRALGGGTGSGFGAYLSEILAEYFPTKTKISVDVFPSPRISSAVVEPYNTVLTTHTTLDQTDMTFMYDNDALYRLCSRYLNNNRPTFTNVNRIMAQVISTITASLRFDGGMKVRLQEYQTNLVPYPRIHFPLVSYSPIIPAEKAYHERFTINSMVSSLFHPFNQMVRCNPRRGRYIACSLLFRGDVTPNDINSVLSSIKGPTANGKVEFVDWSPSGFRAGLCYRPPTCVPGGDLAPLPRAVVGLMNTTAIRWPWRRVARKFDRMLSKRAFLHWYLGEGMEIQEFYDARDDMLGLQLDYSLINTGKRQRKPQEEDFTLWGMHLGAPTKYGPARKPKMR